MMYKRPLKCIVGRVSYRGINMLETTFGVLLGGIKPFTEGLFTADRSLFLGIQLAP